MKSGRGALRRMNETEGQKKFIHLMAGMIEDRLREERKAIADLIRSHGPEPVLEELTKAIEDRSYKDEYHLQSQKKALQELLEL